MKRLKLFTTVALLSLVQAASALVVGGGDISSGGGDSLVMAFTIAGQKACLYLKKGEGHRIPIPVEDFCAAVEGGVKVSSDEVTILNGVEVDAINNRDKKTIVLSQRRNKGKTIDQLKQLAVHEYLAVLKVDDSGYKVSGPIAADLNVESDYFPVRYCEVQQTINAWSWLDSRLEDEPVMKVRYKTEFKMGDFDQFWFDFTGPLRLVKDLDGKSVDLGAWLDTAPAGQETCRVLKSQFGSEAGTLCFSYEGAADILKDFIRERAFSRTLVQLGLSKLRSLTTMNFINPEEPNPFAEYTALSGYLDSSGYRGTHVQAYKNPRPVDTPVSPLKTVGRERFKVDCY